MTRWSHGHSLATGLLLGFALQPHTLWLLTIAFTLGLAAQRLRGWLAELARAGLGWARTPRPGAKRKAW